MDLEPFKRDQYMRRLLAGRRAAESTADANPLIGVSDVSIESYAYSLHHTNTKP